MLQDFWTVSDHFETLCIEGLKTPLLKIFNEPLTFGIFPENMKIAKVTWVFKQVERNYYQTVEQFPYFCVFLKYWRE